MKEKYKGLHLKEFKIDYTDIKPDSTCLIEGDRFVLKTGQDVIIHSFNVQLITNDINDYVKEEIELEKKIVIKNCNECPYQDKLFSDSNNYYCNELSVLEIVKVAFSKIHKLTKEVNTPKKGIHKDCPLKNNYK